jgi:hypothetical protein
MKTYAVQHYDLNIGRELTVFLNKKVGRKQVRFVNLIDLLEESKKVAAMSNNLGLLVTSEDLKNTDGILWCPSFDEFDLYKKLGSDYKGRKILIIDPTNECIDRKWADYVFFVTCSDVERAFNVE